MHIKNLECRLQAWALWCAHHQGAPISLGYPRQSPEQSAFRGREPRGPALCHDQEMEVEAAVAAIARHSPIHAEVLRIEYGTGSRARWNPKYDKPNQTWAARKLGLTLSSYKQYLREARNQVAVVLSYSLT